jgi:Tol biopolymer transport system component
MLMLLAAAISASALLAPIVDYEPNIAADGRIAFVSNRAGPFNVYVMNADGRGIVRLTSGDGVDDTPAWSPDGRWIAYASERDGNSDIYIVAASGGAPRRLTTHPAPDLHPTWSPDGQRLLFNSLRRSNEPTHIDIYEVDADGAGIERRVTGVSASFASWAPGGRIILARVMFGENSDIALLSPRGRVLRRLTHDPAFDGWPSWSADGARIVFARERGETESDIYVMDADGQNERLLIGGPGRKTTPRWTLDGAIVYSLRIDGETRLRRAPASE